MLSTMIRLGMAVQYAGKALCASHNKGSIIGLEVGIDPNVAVAREGMGHST